MRYNHVNSFKLNLFNIVNNVEDIFIITKFYYFIKQNFITLLKKGKKRRQISMCCL